LRIRRGTRRRGNRIRWFRWSRGRSGAKECRPGSTSRSSIRPILRETFQSGNLGNCSTRRCSPVVDASGIEQDDLGSSFNQPSTVDQLDTSLPHGIESESERGSSGAEGEFRLRRECNFSEGNRTHGSICSTSIGAVL
jgi:hypothetical protein